jgi:hypothetical protein
VNRAERRRQKKVAAKADRVVNIKAADVTRIKENATIGAANKAFILMLAIPMIVLRDDFGFGGKRLTKFIDRALEQYKCFESGAVTIDELRQIIYEETGVSISG